MTSHDHSEPSEKQRANSAQAILSQLSALPSPGRLGWTPVWSSAVLERTIAQILNTSDGDIRGLLRGLWDLLQDTNAPLSNVMRNFIQEIVTLCFTRYRSKYESEDFGWMEALARGTCTEAQAWYALLALPEPWQSRNRDVILTALENSPYLREAQLMYED